MGAVLLLLLLGVVLSSCHEIYPGKCPEFTPMEKFNWDKVRIKKITESTPLNNLRFYYTFPVRRTVM
jgi:hypothetical protein